MCQTGQRRLVEAEFTLQLLDEFGRQAARALVALVFHRARVHIRACAVERAEDVALPFHAGDDLFDRAAGHELSARKS